MTEAEWLACADPTPMHNFLCLGLKVSRTKLGRRKLRLHACSCGRRVWHLLNNQSHRAIEVAERFAEGLATTTELEKMWRRVCDSVTCGTACAPISVAIAQTASVGQAVAALAAVRQRQGKYEEARCAENKAQADLVRDIFGNPFRPVVVDSSWLTSDVLALATGVYEGRVFDRMPILADALQDAGCDNEDVLSHCRGDGLHVRGCWVVDLLLGKT
ncbi:Uncharacterized protein OS=Sorangium cellulosum (strain So ce56) GN=sce5710 PE=4 SV=1 [Gemmata massiliana]|uniref:SMI1/KNR4 family protein n=1 Tax=Gemmata massiliana TaxID=1210884 RepID=A0A6P2D3U0_9BACT|nr:hypothetical protein [Gemmata massiliana]VTR95537.1 Uncharacterized protein OS=Sorangium cellulosum (strain So ce56) GN=sce5710 PE=4 SV=1 [Gemmata massiliana]